MPEIKDVKDATDAALGDTVELGKKSYQEVEDEGGKRFEMAVPLLVRKAYNRDGVLAKKAEAEAIVVECDAIIAEMDKAGF